MKTNPLGYPWAEQGDGPDCVAVDAINAALYTGVSIPDRNFILREFGGIAGPVIQNERCYSHFGLKWKSIGQASEVDLSVPCIINLKHPRFGWHAVFTFPHKERVWAVNSLLDTRVGSWTEDELREYMVSKDNQDTHFVLQFNEDDWCRKCWPRVSPLAKGMIVVNHKTGEKAPFQGCFQCDPIGGAFSNGDGETVYELNA